MFNMSSGDNYRPADNLSGIPEKCLNCDFFRTYELRSNEARQVFDNLLKPEYRGLHTALPLSKLHFENVRDYKKGVVARKILAFYERMMHAKCGNTVAEYACRLTVDTTYDNKKDSSLDDRA